jgi:putative holliday junction resolvase
MSPFPPCPPSESYPEGGTIALVRALGVDYGRKRIGLALSDATGMLARPWKTIARAGNARQVAAALARETATLAAEPDGLAAIVIGWPRRLSGEPTELTAAVEALAAQLRQLTDISVVLQDERLTSREAESILAATEKDWRKRKPLVDAAAAAIILQDYLDAHPRPSREEEDIA